MYVKNDIKKTTPCERLRVRFSVNNLTEMRSYRRDRNNMYIIYVLEVCPSERLPSDPFSPAPRIFRFHLLIQTSKVFIFTVPFARFMLKN